MNQRWIGLLGAAFLATGAHAQEEVPVEPPPDGIEQTARAYVEGVLDGDATRVQRAAHELLAKRRVAREYWGRASREWLKSISREQLPGLISYLQEAGTVSPADDSPDIEVLSWTPTTASVRAQSGAGIQFLHLMLGDGAWIVVDDAYDLDSTPPERGDERDIRMVVSNYARGLYERAPIKSLGSCHVSLAMREVVPAERGMMLNPISYEELELYVLAYNDYYQFEPRRATRDVEILATTDSLAAVRLDGENWVDLIHLAKVNGNWLIIDVLKVTD